MATAMSPPRFTKESLDALHGIGSMVRDRVYNLLEDLLLKEKRSVISEEDVRQCYLQAVRELLEDSQEFHPGEHVGS